MEKEVVTLEDVEHVMKLSRLECADNEKEGYQKDLNDIVEYFGILSQVNVDGIDAVIKPEGKLRPDEVGISMDKSDVVRNAPVHNESAFIVPRVVE